MSRAKKEEAPRFPEFRAAFLDLMGDMTLQEFADKLEMSRATVGFYAAGKRIPDALGIKAIAEKCNVSADWLLGLSNAKSTDEDVKSICKYLELSESAVSALKRISADNIMDYFGKEKDLEHHIYASDGMSDLFSSDAFYRAVIDISKAISFECIAKKAGEKKDDSTGEI